MNDKCTVYFDEYGNTGNNLLDKNQPYYIVCGWIVPNNLINDIKGFLSEALGEYNPNMKELKGKTLLQTRKGRGFLIHLIMQMLDIGCIPIISISNKNYIASAKLCYLLDDCIEPAILHRQNLMLSTENRINFAQKLAEICPNEVSHFAKILRKPDMDNLLEVFNEIHLKLLSNNSEYAHLFSKEIVDFNEALWSLNNELTSQPRKAASAVNLPVFTALLTIIEDIGRKNGLKIDVFCDEVLQFKEAFQNYSEYMKNGTDFHYSLDNGMTAWFDLKNTFYKGMLKSDDDPLIQMADLLCSTIQTLIVNHNDSEKEKDLAIVGYLIANFTMNFNTIHYMMNVNELSSFIKKWKRIGDNQLKKI